MVRDEYWSGGVFVQCKHTHLLEDGNGCRCYHCGKPFIHKYVWKWGELWFWLKELCDD